MIISYEDQKVIDQAIYLPLLIINLNRDIKVIKQSQFILKQPYIDKVEDTLRRVQMDYSKVKKHMRDNHIKVERLETEGDFTKYLIYYKGQEQDRGMFNPVLKRRTEELQEKYMTARL